MENFMSWLLSSILQVNNTEISTEKFNDILNLYTCTLQKYGHQGSSKNIDVIPHIMTIFSPFLNKINMKIEERSDNIDTEIVFFKSLNATVSFLNDFNHVESIGMCIIKLLERSISNSNNAKFHEQEVLKYNLKILQELIESSKIWTINNFNKILPIVLLYLRYGLLSDYSLIPSNLEPSPIVQWETPSRLDISQTTNLTNKRRQKKKRITESKNKVPKLVAFTVEEENLMNIRDSDFSEDEPMTNCTNGCNTWDIRLLAAQTMKKLFTIVEKKTVLGYLYTIIDGPFDIQSCLRLNVDKFTRDPSSKVRATVVTAITSIFNGSKIFFSQAQYREKKGAFTTWSDTLAEYIINIHNTLMKAFEFETHGVRLVLLHCFSTMVINTPYPKLCKNLLGSLLTILLMYTKCEPCENYLRIGVLRCFSSIFNCDLPDIERDSLKKIRCDIVNLCLYLFKETKLYLDSDQDNIQIILRRQCWQMLTSYCNLYDGLIENRMLINIAVEDLKYTKQNLLRKNIILCLKQMSSVSEGKGYHTAKLEKWKLIFKKVVPQLLEEQDTFILSVLIESLSTIGSEVFSNLEDELVNPFCNSLHSYANSLDQNIQSSAIATLGIFIKYEKLLNRPEYIEDTIDILLNVCLTNKVNSIQEKLAWTFNCIAEVLVGNWKLYKIENNKLFSLVEVTISTLDRKPCRACGTRALGLLLSLFDQVDIIETQAGSLFQHSIEVLINIANSNDSMKNRWNSCNSLGVVYQTNYLYKLPILFKNNIFNTLSILLINCSNFKVRQLACSSLTFSQRELYGTNFIKMWHRIFDAFENAQNLPHVCEYKHKQKLTNQLCETFCNLCRLLEPMDIGNLTDLLNSRLYLVQEEMNKYCNSLEIPNFSEKLVVTHNNLQYLLKCTQLNYKQKEAVQNLLNIFYNH
ncbi:uncharacterized protein LOC126902414 isoform X2 [Daktulosphaira vitifoliae]|nr:uncharacterized protein LOC126902414 isoform X2 [Daktulosphaira vitifoliae]